MKPQVVIIHGGTTFDTYEEYMEYLRGCELTVEKLTKRDWKDNFSADIGSDFDILYPKMPNAKNARYEEWKIWFEKLFPLLRDGVVLVGHSLGGIFLAKYLSENSFPKNIASLHLVAAPYDTEVVNESLADFALTGAVENLNDIKNVFIYQSKDDPAVGFLDAEKYKRDIPNATLEVFDDRGHFIQEHFPELIENIKKSN